MMFLRGTLLQVPRGNIGPYIEQIANEIKKELASLGAKRGDGLSGGRRTCYREAEVPLRFDRSAAAVLVQDLEWNLDKDGGAWERNCHAQKSNRDKLWAWSSA